MSPNEKIKLVITLLDDGTVNIKPEISGDVNHAAKSALICGLLEQAKYSYMVVSTKSINKNNP